MRDAARYDGLMLNVALKEWAVICDLLLAGRQALLLRKGGIAEWGGPGVFELEHPRFVLFPSWAHQKPAMIKREWVERVPALDEPTEIPLRGFAEAARVWRVTDRARFDQLDDLHAWARPYVDMRFGYKPERPLYLLAVRVHVLAQPKTIRNHAEYEGCRSWVPLRAGDEVDESGATPAVDDASLAAVMQRVDAALGD